MPRRVRRIRRTILCHRWVPLLFPCNRQVRRKIARLRHHEPACRTCIIVSCIPVCLVSHTVLFTCHLVPIIAMLLTVPVSPVVVPYNLDVSIYCHISRTSPPTHTVSARPRPFCRMIYMITVGSQLVVLTARLGSLPLLSTFSRGISCLRGHTSRRPVRAPDEYLLASPSRTSHSLLTPYIHDSSWRLQPLRRLGRLTMNDAASLSLPMRSSGMSTTFLFAVAHHRRLKTRRVMENARLRARYCRGL